MPVPFAEASLSPVEMPESFLGRGQLGERPSAPPLMTMHQLGSHDQFVVRSCNSTSAIVVYDLSYCILSCLFYHYDSSSAAADTPRSCSVQAMHVAIMGV